MKIEGEKNCVNYFLLFNLKKKMIIMRRRQETEQKKGILHMDTPTDSRGIYCRRNKLKEKTATKSKQKTKNKKLPSALVAQHSVV